MTVSLLYPVIAQTGQSFEFQNAVAEIIPEKWPTLFAAKFCYYKHAFYRKMVAVVGYILVSHVVIFPMDIQY